MSSSSGNSSGTTGTTQLQNWSSEEELQQMMMAERKRKRMQSNRESARRSRMRKQKQLDDLTAQVAQLREENSKIASTTYVATQHFLSVEAQNSILRTQMAELRQRLESLDDILKYINSFNGGFMESWSY
ncbi:hypothetical protein Nepgr_019326 [Nepenthes gracilis]|uniref:BZIP domain-containing protein n=1 Tax=Nepenthes gracilis TaxID=150966 RepID=A0AAD3SUY3_NEPGR|nr:hypothetical protein Nepgr_019326 [Nepenthes gracilis]